MRSMSRSERISASLSASLSASTFGNTGNQTIGSKLSVGPLSLLLNHDMKMKNEMNLWSRSDRSATRVAGYPPTRLQLAVERKSARGFLWFESAGDFFIGVLFFLGVRWRLYWATVATRYGVDLPLQARPNPGGHTSKKQFCHGNPRGRVRA